MGITAEQLIVRSLFLSGVVARNLQYPTGDQISAGLDMLNSLLDFKQIEIDLVPYYQYITAPCVPGQEFYYLPNVADIESLTFNINVVRYPMDQVSRRNYYGSSRVDNIASLPFSWTFERAQGGGNLAMYFLPSQNYQLKMMVKIFLTDVSLNTDLTNITETFTNPNNIPFFTPYTFFNSSNQGFDTSYIEYLRYALAQFICSEFGIMFNPESEKVLKKYERKLMYISPPDLSLKKTSILMSDSQSGFTWADVNLGMGWRPS